MTAPISDGTMPCPVPHPDGDANSTCVRTIPKGWTAGEGHGGGHMWMSATTKTLPDSGHYDATAAIAGPPFGAHDPADCDYSCPRFWDNTPTTTTPEEIR